MFTGTSRHEGMQRIRRTAPRVTPLRAFVFTDLVDSTGLLERLGDRRFALLMGEHNRLVRRVLHRHGGSEGVFLGDGFMITFASAADALEFAQALRLQARRALPPEARLRIGLHAGTAVRADGTWIGRDVVIARRLCDQAGADEILVSAQLRALVSPAAVRYEDDRRLALKGLPGLHPACPLASC